jgi:hypothetical protein
MRFFASSAWASLGSSPASSIARTNQYQFPELSSATGLPVGSCFKNRSISSSLCSTRTGGSHRPSSRTLANIE